MIDETGDKRNKAKLLNVRVKLILNLDAKRCCSKSARTNLMNKKKREMKKQRTRKKKKLVAAMDFQASDKIAERGKGETKKKVGQRRLSGNLDKLKRVDIGE